MAEIRANVTLTELPHFRRLVAFLEDAERLADARVDLELQDLVKRAREDLLGMPYES